MTNQRIDWDKLRVFKVVAELGSMTSAAARLRESPPTVSRKIDELEEFLSSKLFTRSTRGMELTETGKTVLRYARQMEESANEVLSKAIGKTDGTEGRITIGSGDGVGPYWIAPRLAEFQTAHPRAQVRMHVKAEEPDLLNDEADISIQFTEPRDPEIISHKLGTLVSHPESTSTRKRVSLPACSSIISTGAFCTNHMFSKLSDGPPRRMS